MSDSSLLVSVVMPLPDHRGQATNSLNSYLNQTLDSSRYEVIVTTDGKYSELETEIETQFPDVRMIRQHGSSEVELYNVGAAVAKGRYLFITEIHCVAKPDCLEKILDFISNTDYSAACCHSYGINRNRFSEGEQHLFEKDLKQIRKNGNSKPTIRGFLIKRDIWEHLGGFQAEYGHFSEVMFGRRMKLLNMDIGYADHAIVGHYNQVAPGPLLKELVPYGYSECRSADIASVEDGGGACQEWVKFEDGLISPTGLKLRTLIIRTKLPALYTAMRLLSFSNNIYYYLYATYWQEAIRLGRLQYIADAIAGRTSEDNR